MSDGAPVVAMLRGQLEDAGDFRLADGWSFTQDASLFYSRCLSKVEVVRLILITVHRFHGVELRMAKLAPEPLRVRGVEIRNPAKRARQLGFPHTSSGGIASGS